MHLPAISNLEQKIFILRGEKVMLSHDLAKLYGVETKVLNQAVQRNLGRFPEDFMFQLNKAEEQFLKSQIVTSKTEGRGGARRALPYAFTEQGIAILSSVLKSEQAIQVNIAIMRSFVRFRQEVASNHKLAEAIRSWKRKLLDKMMTLKPFLPYSTN